MNIFNLGNRIACLASCVDLFINHHVGHPAQDKLGWIMGESNGDTAVRTGHDPFMSVDDTVRGECTLETAGGNCLDCAINYNGLADRLCISRCHVSCLPSEIKKVM